MAAQDKPGAMAAADRAVSLSPRNEGYLYNQAQIYISSGRVGDGIAILKRLANSGNPEMASTATETLARAQSYLLQVQQASAQMNVPPTPPRPPSQGTPGEHPGEIAREVSIPVKVSTVPSRYLKGNLSKVDCSADPAAVLTVTSGPKTMKLHVKDSKHLILIGADSFSCAWTNQKVGINYYPSGEAEGDVISLELQ